MFIVFFLYALFGSVFIIEKTCLNYTQPLFLIGSRMILAGLLLVVYGYFTSKQKKVLFQAKHIWMLVRLAVFNIYFTNVFEIWALNHLDAFKTCFIYSLSPFIAAMFSYFIFSEKLSTKKWIGLMVGCLGFLPMVIDKPFVEQQVSLYFFSWAEIAMLFAVLCSVYGWIALKQVVQEEGYSPFEANGMSMLIGGIMALCHSICVESWDPIPVNNLGVFLGFLVALIIISNLICYNLYGVLLKKYSATFMSFAGFSTPLFTAFFGWIYLGEMVTLSFFVSATIVFIGLLIFSQDEKKLIQQEVEISPTY